MIAELHTQFSNSELHIYKAEELADISVPNPSEKVKEVTGVDGVAEKFCYPCLRLRQIVDGKAKKEYYPKEIISPLP